MTLLFIPSVVALLIKALVLLKYGSRILQENPYLMLSLIALCGLNISEFVIFWNVGAPEQIEAVFSVRSYYAFAELSSMSVLAMAAYVLWGSKHSLKVLMGIAMLVAVYTMASDGFIAGVQSFGYTLSRQPGTYFSVLQIYLLSMLFGALLIMGYGILYGDTPLKQKKSLVILIAFSPVIVLAIVIIVVMSFGIRVNATGILSLASSMMVWLLAYAETRYGLFRILTYIPNTAHYRLHKKISDIEIKLAGNISEGSSIQLKQVVRQLESAIIEMALEASYRDKLKAAKMLTIGRTSIDRKLDIND